jgi:hypothetical protein
MRTTFEAVYDTEENISNFFHFSPFRGCIFLWKANPCLYSDNILILTLSININSINIIKYFWQVR